MSCCVIRQKRPIYTAKETYLNAKRDLFIRTDVILRVHTPCGRMMSMVWVALTLYIHIHITYVAVSYACASLVVSSMLDCTGTYAWHACKYVCLRDDIYMCVCVCVYVCVCVRVCVSIYPATLTGPPGKRPRATHPSASANVVSA